MDKQRYIFLPELRAPNFGSIDQRYSVLDEWDLVTAFVEFMSNSSTRMAKQGRTYPHIIIRLKVRRKWKIYVINILLLLFALTGLSLSAFYLNYEQLGERLGLLITLILTSVAFSIVIQDKLPNVTYLTFMDKYILTSYAFLIVIVIESVLISTVEEDVDKQQDLDQLLFYIFSSLWVIIFGAFFGYYAWKLIKREHEKINMSSDEINDKVNKTLPTLKFNYKNLSRTGHKKRILSFMASTSINDDKKEYHGLTSSSKQILKREEKLKKEHEEYTQMRRNMSLATENQSQLQSQQYEE